MYGGRGRIITTEVLIGSILIALIMTVGTYIMVEPTIPSGDYGICLPSPNNWHIPSFLSWFLTVAIVAGTAFLAYLSNKKYNLISTTEPLLPVTIILLLSCNALITVRLGTPVIMMAVNAICLYILFETYEKFNSTQEFFFLATFLSFGSMVEYSFLMMIPVYIVGGVLMKSLRWREIIAFLFGIIAPYWILVGLGVISIFNFKLPESTELTTQLELNPNLYLSLISVGFAGLLALVASLYNSYLLLNGNSRIRCMHLAISILGYICLLFMIADFNNIMAYSGTIYLWCALEVASLFGSGNFRNSWIWLLSFVIIFFILYTIML